MFGGFKARLNLLGGKRNDNRSELSSDLYVNGAYRVNRENTYGYSFSTQDVPKSKPTELPPTLRPVKSTGNLQEEPTTVNQNTRNSNPAISRHPRGDDQTNNTGVSRKELKHREKEQKKIEKQQVAQRKKDAQEKAKQEKLKEKAKREEQKAKRNGRKEEMNNKQGKPIQPPAQPQTSPNNTPQQQRSNPLAQPVNGTPKNITKLPVNKTTQLQTSANNPPQLQTSNPLAQPVNTTPKNITKLPDDKTMQPAKIPSPPVTKTSQPANKTKQPAKSSIAPAPPANKTTQPANKTTQSANKSSHSANKTTEPANKTTQSASKTTQPAYKTTQPANRTDTLGSSISRSSGPPPYSELPEPIGPKTDTTGNVVYGKPMDTGSWDIISQHREQMNRPAVSNSKRKQMVLDLNYFGSANADNSDA